MTELKINATDINWGTAEVEFGVIHSYEEYEAWFSYAERVDGIPLTVDELNYITEEYTDILDQRFWDHAQGMADFLD
jgi:hypothetical protein